VRADLTGPLDNSVLGPTLPAGASFLAAPSVLLRAEMAQVRKPRSCTPATAVRELRGDTWEEPVTELTEQASEKCHKHLVAGLRLICPAERVTAIAKAMREVEAREKRRQSDAGQRHINN
jgi:hypothetical protein